VEKLSKRKKRRNLLAEMVKKYYIITYGCQMNKSDSEKIAAFLEKNKLKPALTRKQADLIVINMCSVRQSAVDRVNGFKKHPKNKEIILTGCILKKDKPRFRKKFNQIWLKETFFNLKPKTKKQPLSYIAISNGCNNFCSYCVVPFTRGPLVCYSHKKIINQVKQAVKQKKKEIWLLGQNVNDYSSPVNKKIDFPELIKLIDKIPGNFKFFFVSPHPKNFSDKLINVLAQSKKFGEMLNLPLQSGDNQILKKMNRNYTVKEYQNLVKKIREKIPTINLTTDIIVGFPGETKKQFENTKKLFKETKFNQAYISKYSTRPGTAAFNLKDNVSLIEKKKREQCLRKLLSS
jgi:tRNA-2-methylthio-N6-dimethylallyladenosine synthase